MTGRKVPFARYSKALDERGKRCDLAPAVTLGVIFIMSLTGIEFFSGAGGMSVGAQWAGIKIAAAVEIDPNAAKSYTLNHPSTTVIQGDIRAVTSIMIGPPEKLVVFGGPPCQGFSTSNQRTRTADNQNNWLFQEFCRLVRVIRPAFVVFENVRGVTETEGGIFVEQILAELKEAGYDVNYGLLNAVDFGVPQSRTRFFIIASRVGPAPPLPTASEVHPVSVWDAIGDLPPLSNGAEVGVLPYRSRPLSSFAACMRGDLESCSGHKVSKNADYIIERYKHISQGGNWEDIPEELMKNYKDRTRCHTGIYHRLREDTPAVVIGNYRKNMLIHPREDRGLSVREAARLQSFPDNYQFTGSIGFQQQQVGNAVPPLLARAVFKSLSDWCNR